MTTKHPAMARTARSYRSFACLYDRLIGDRMFPLVRRNFDWLVRRYGIRFGSIADVACGTGTFLRDVWRPGLWAFGVDRSSSMLGIARSKNAGNGTIFLKQDLRQLRLPHPVDLITCHFDSLNYLLSAEDLALAFRSFRNNLNRGGAALFDMVTDYAEAPRFRLNLQLFRLPGVVSLWRILWNPINQTRRVSMLNYFHAGANAVSVERERHVQRPYPVAVVVSLIRSCGLGLRGVHDAHSLAAAGPATYRAVYAVVNP